MSNSMRGLKAVLLMVLSTGAGAATSPLPPDPSQWVCTRTEVDPQQIGAWCRSGHRGRPADLGQRPAALSDLAAKNRYDEALRDFLRERRYVGLDWPHDRNWRLTGPYVGDPPNGASYGVHPAVRIYYSPGVVDWLCSGREGALPDGAMIVKEMHPIDQSLGIELGDDGCMDITATDPAASSWAVMVKDNAASHDGWYWYGISATGIGNPPILDRSAVTSDAFFEPPPETPRPDWFPTGDLFGATVHGQVKQADVVYPYNMFGNYCVNCHASAVSESTYSTLENILGVGLRYKGYDMPQADQAGHDSGSLHDGTRAESTDYPSPFARPLQQPGKDFLAFYDQLAPVGFHHALGLRLPAETYDHVVSGADGPERFLSSDQCIGCHDATFSNAGTPNMLVDDDGKSINLSPYAEWRASPMGLAGRDPIFFSQLQSETNNLPELSECIENTCLHCHGVMGQRQLARDTAGGDQCKSLFAVPPPDQVPFGEPFRLAMVAQYQDGDHARYGALARDGISCTVCHHIDEQALGEDSSYTGNFVTGPADTLYGPFEDVVTKPMKHALGITPQHGAQTRDSALCGSCHNILLPVFSNAGERLGASYEQTTHLEWLNSVYARPGEDFRSCQDCHMPNEYRGRSLDFKIANIEDDTFAPTDNRLPDAEIALTPRDTFARHSLHGLNVFLNEMFQQFPLLLGVRQIDYMTGSGVQPGLITGRESMLTMADEETASVGIDSLERTADGRLRAVVTVTNKTGHYLPSGVGFRRVLLEFLVKDAGGRLLWASGRSNELGVVLDGVTGQPLASEQPLANPKAYQPHYQTITRPDQAQIYQELIVDSDGNFTTSFMRRAKHIKDNRLRPHGYDPAFYLRNASPYIQELATTYGAAKDDNHYTDPQRTGSDRIEYLIELEADDLARVATVEANLYSQSIPPGYLQQRFRDAGRGPGHKAEIERLYYLTSHLDTTAKDADEQAFIADWKLKIAGAEQTLDSR